MSRRRLTSVTCAIAVVASGVGGCRKTPPVLPTPIVLLETPPPPARLLIPVELQEPPAPEPESPEPPPQPPAPVRREPVTVSRSTEKPAAPAPVESTPPPVLRTTADTAAAERKVLQLLDAAEQNLGRVNYRDLNANARTQYDSARTFIRMANDALKNRNYTYAEYLASRAATLGGELVKG